MPYPDEANLPFNRAILENDFTPGSPDQDRPDAPGFWILLQEGNLVVRETEHGVSLPQGHVPVAGPWAVTPVYLGTWQGLPLRAGRLTPEAVLPRPYAGVLSNHRNQQLDDRLLTLSGLARQVLHWRDRSRICPACGGTPQAIAGSFGARCPACGREYYPRIHPAVIVHITRGEEFLMVRKAEWPAGQYGLVAGYVEFCESLEECVAREVLEETGLAVTDIRYHSSQSWPFPSQIMVGFTAVYAGGDIVMDRDELEDAAWFRADKLPPRLPPRSSVARALLDRYVPGLGTTP
jgi:NAD+ diphosphatase